MLVLGERQKSGEMSVGIERSKGIRGDATVRKGPAAEAHTDRSHSLELQVATSSMPTRYHLHGRVHGRVSAT